MTKILQKMFGFQKTEDEKNEGGSLLSLKLLNLAIILSLTNLLLNILKHRNLPFLLGEKEEIVKKEIEKNEGDSHATRESEER